VGDVIWLSVTEYAAHRGVSKAAVSKAIKNKRLDDAIDGTGKRKKINRDLADELWNNSGKLKVDNVKNEVNKQENQGQEIPQQSSHGQRYAQSRAMKEIYAAKNEQLKYEERSGNLCKTEDVVKAVKEKTKLTRDYLLNLPDKLAPILAAETDLDEIHKLLTTEINNALTNLSQGKIF